MDNYKMLLDDIKDFLNNQEIKSNLWCCSLYDLYMMLNNGLKEFSDIIKNSKIKKLLMKNPILFKTQIDFDGNNQVVYITLKDSKNNIKATVYKNKNSNDISIGDPQSENNKIYCDFVNKNHDLFLETLSKYEEYISLLCYIKSKTLYLEDSMFESLFESKLSYNEFGEVNITLEINEIYTLEKKIYLEKNIEDFIDDNKEEILKRFPVHLDFIEKPFNNFYREFYSCTHNYNLIKNKIIEFINKEEKNNQKNNMEIINLYDFFNIINGELEEFRNLILNLELKEKIEKFSIFTRKMVPTIRVTKDKTIIRFGNEKTYDIVEIWKNKKNFFLHIDNLAVDKNEHFNKFKEKNYELILNILIKIEEYTDLLGGLIYNFTNFENDLFEASLIIAPNGEVDIKITPKIGNMLFNQRKDISKLIQDHKEEILKRIIISPHKLEDPFKNIYNKYKEKEIKNQKIKVLSK